MRDFIARLSGRAVLIGALTPVPAWAQGSCPGNLISNPGFEAYSACPPDYDFLSNATGWSLATRGSADFFHNCSPSNNVHVPNHIGGFEWGVGLSHGYAGLIAYGQGNSEYREYIQNALISPLLPNRIYSVSFYVSLDDSSDVAISDLGAAFTVGALNVNTLSALSIAPNVVNNLGIISKKTGPAPLYGWTHVCLAFHSGAGGQTHMTIGNFANDANTHIQVLGGNGTDGLAYYLFDDICVNLCSVAPAFTQHPSSATVSFCDGATFSADAGCGVLYQWYISCSGGAGSPLSETSGFFTGVTSPALHLSSQAVASYQGCSFYVVATNDCGTATSDSASVTLDPVPRVSPATLSVCPPEPASLSVTFPGSGYQYRWYQRPAGSGRTGTRIPNATGPILDHSAPAFWQPTPEDCGDEIYCEIYKPGCGYVTSNAVLIECCPCEPPPPGMALWLPFDQVSGSPALTRNVVAYGASGILMPIGSGPSLYPKEHVVNSLWFDGVDDHVLVQDPGLLNVGAGDLSIDAWIFVEGAQSLRQVIVDKMDTGPGTARGFRLSAYSTGQGTYLLELTLGDGGAPVTWTAVGASAAFDSGWHHIALTLDRTSTPKRGRFYVDGSQVTVIDPSLVSGSLSSTAPLLIGARNASAPTDCFLGGIDEVEVFPRVLSPIEIQSLDEANGIGKCKQFVEVVTPAIFCGDDTSTVINVNVFNFTPTPYALGGIFATDPTCLLLPIPNFPFTMTLPVSAYGFNTASVTANRPLGMSAFDQTCYDAAFTAAGFNASDFGQIVYRPDIACGGWPATLRIMPLGDWTEATLGFGNLAMASDFIAIRIEAIGPDGEPSRTLSINDAIPGVPFEETTFVPQGGQYEQTVGLRFTHPDTLGVTTLMLSTDVDHDGIFEPAAVLPLRCTTPGEPCPADLSGSSDPNDPAYGIRDGFADAADFFYYLDQFAKGCY